MFIPKYTITDNLLSNIKRIATLISDLNHQSFPKVVLAELEKNARVISSFSSTSIEGNPLPLTEVKKILKNKPENIRDSELEVLNYNSALLKLNKLIVENKVSIDLKFILEIQKIVTHKLLPKHQNGKLRKEPVFVNNPRTGKPIYLPPDHNEVDAIMEDLIHFTNKYENKTDPLILAGIFHKQFVLIHPLADGNGRTTRLVTKLLLAKMGLNTFSLFSFENYYNQNVTKYFDKVGELGNYYEIRDKIDFTEWLEYFTSGIIDELLRVSKDSMGYSVTPENTLKPHHHLIVNYIEKNGFITDREYSKLTDRAKATRSLDFRKLIELGVVEMIGRGKATYYKLIK